MDVQAIPDLNNVLLVGQLASDAEIRLVADAEHVTVLNLVVGQDQESTHVTIVAFGAIGEAAKQHQKNDAVLIEGKLRSREVNNGNKYTLVEIVAKKIQLLQRKVS